MQIQTEAIVLKRTKYADKDIILQLFTRKLGKTSVFVKNGQTLKSPMMSSAQLFSYSNFFLKMGSSMHRAASAQLYRNFYRITEDLDATYLAYYILETVEQSIGENQSNNRLFDLLLTCLQALNDKDRLEYVFLYFLLKFSSFMGMKPQLRECVLCGKNATDRYLFNNRSGGLICSDCSLGDSVSYDNSTYRLIDFILQREWSEVRVLNVSDAILSEAISLTRDYVHFHFSELRWKTEALLSF